MDSSHHRCQIFTAVVWPFSDPKTKTLKALELFFRPTPSWLPPGRSTRSIACCKNRVFFSVQRLHGFRQVVQYALWHCRIINFQINARGRLLIEDRKRELVRDLYMSKKPSFHEQHKQKTKNNKKRQTDNKSNHKPKQPKQKTKTKQTENNNHRNDWLPVHWRISARGDNFVSSHLGMATTRKTPNREKRTPTHTRPYPQVIEATQHHAEIRDPPSQDPRDHKAHTEKYNDSP